jgi:S-formylglutathione hydrolase FrmB
MSDVRLETTTIEGPEGPMLERTPERARPVALRVSRGASDRWIEANRALRAKATELHLPLEYDESPAGHGWPYWQHLIPDHIAWHARVLAGQ